MVAVCISQAAADKVSPGLFRETRIALRPSESEMIDALER
jgi:hypothetical protein